MEAARESSGTGHGHSHDHSHVASSNRRRLLLAMAIIAGVLVAEAVGAWLSGSLALLADAAHMFSDLTGLAVALLAVTVSARPATDRSTYGHQRAEVFAAFANGAILIGVVGFIAVEAILRLVNPEPVEVLGGPMLIVAVVGALANVAALLVLRGGSGSINMRAAYLEVLGDLIGSVTVIIAAIVVIATGLIAADGIASLVVAALIVPRAIALLREVAGVLAQSTPRGTDVEVIRNHVLATEGVLDVHDVHVWAITPGTNVFSAHVVVTDDVFSEHGTGPLLQTLSECLADHFDVDHSTFQFEPPDHAEREARQHR